ncbi:hypothetical protein CEUSTIGMA_g10104.t1 [Chlamydomonas eustigma]|uniref:Uncharacterized protein n=1 Tax=Chlamydomonas eustigma TaxID=1157962 RepID=A0A250XHX9_9CHLO|nr:hypothetical protein CEUSTIGMA_g10104.t1 [Chlamydomonas eustigma]|eukprot:GAX82678.1 hypothetical protein CEUSTIGMA_g10104.t1 [Chlamydomonas eustigma]
MDESEWELIDTAIGTDFELVETTPVKNMECTCNHEQRENSLGNLKISIVRVRMLTEMNKVTLSIFVLHVDGERTKEDVDSSTMLLHDSSTFAVGSATGSAAAAAAISFDPSCLPSWDSPQTLGPSAEGDDHEEETLTHEDLHTPILLEASTSPTDSVYSSRTASITGEEPEDLWALSPDNNSHAPHETCFPPCKIPPPPPVHATPPIMDCSAMMSPANSPRDSIKASPSVWMESARTPLQHLVDPVFTLSPSLPGTLGFPLAQQLVVQHFQPQLIHNVSFAVEELELAGAPHEQVISAIVTAIHPKDATVQKTLDEDDSSPVTPTPRAALRQDATAESTSKNVSGRRCGFRFWRWAVPSVMLAAAVATRFLWGSRRTASAAACVNV